MQHAILLIPLTILMTTALCFISDMYVGDVKTNGRIALISELKTFSLFSMITAFTLCIPFLLLLSYSGFNRYPYQLLSSYS